ncbi:WXG100 family type VII secretion target [Amycolatopsis minnesotensis]|uniref:PPE domain-containing protein n=1 Tax=Amycolatopsis minnesotensis TaxID=337894 RepID=A0ABN2S725_9PSEU
MSTNFAAYSHQQLYAMLQAGDAATARTAAQQWQATATGLHDQAGGLTDELHGFEDGWRGGAADKYRTMITDLVGGIRKVAHTASAMRDLLEDAADDLDKAKAEMPPPVDVPAVSPADISLAANPPLLPADASQDVVLAAARQRATAISSVQAQQQAAATANAAHDKAVVVMTTLATGYTTTEQSIPAAPDAAEVPGAPAPGGSPGGGHDGGGLPSGAPDGTTVVPGGQPTAPADGGTTPGGTTPGAPKPASPLFGDMFTAGLAAASAAAFGRFGSIMPKVPGWASGKKPEGDKDREKDPAGTAVTGGSGGGIPDAAGGLGGSGGLGGFDGGAIGGGAGVDGAAPAAHTGLSGATGTGGALSGLAGGAAGAAGAAAAKSAMPMMPFMPMGMGAGDLGSGRRIPPWLVETEDVWGESAAVAPPVIGTEPDAR